METTEEEAQVTLLNAPFVTPELFDAFKAEVERVNNNPGLNPNTGLPRVS